MPSIRSPRALYQATCRDGLPALRDPVSTHDKSCSLTDAIQKTSNGSTWGEALRRKYEWNPWDQMSKATKYVNGSASHSGFVWCEYCLSCNFERTLLFQSTYCVSIVVVSAGGGQESRSEAIVRNAAVYILASQRNGTLYVGVTNDLKRRVWEHRNGLIDGFSKKYDVHTLVFYEPHMDMREAIVREKQIKKWKRGWKINLIEKTNQEWRDLWEEVA